MGSCVSTLRRIQEDAGITEKDLKRAVHNIATPREVTLEEISVNHKESKFERQQKKLRQKASKKRRRELAYWFLEQYLKPEFARQYYIQYPDFGDLVDAAYEGAIGIIQLNTFMHGEIDPLEVFPESELDEYDIPDAQWEAFGKWCKTHPLKKRGDILARRERFMKSLRKTKRKYYSKKRLAIYDPLFAQTHIDEKQMLKNLEEITEQNELRVKEFHKMLESLYKDNGISADVMKKFDKQTKSLIEHHRRRTHEFIKRMHHDKPTPVTFQMDDEPEIVFDDWDHPETSLDSVFKIPIKDV